MTPREAREAVGRAWCTEKTKNTEMDVELATAFADILVEETQRLDTELSNLRLGMLEIASKISKDIVRLMEADECRDASNG